MVLATVLFDTTDPEGFLQAVGGTAHLFEGAQGFSGFELRRGVEDRHQFLITANWDSVRDHVSWQNAHAGEFLAMLEPFTTGPPEIRHYDPLGEEPESARGVDRESR